MSAPSLTVLQTGPLATVQDAGRCGQASVGIGRSGACDRTAYRLANRLLGNDEDCAVLEVTFGGLTVRAEADLQVATTGARCGGGAHNAPMRLRAGAELQLGPPASGMRTYLAVRGGIDVPPVLGSRCTDTLSGLGPPRLRAGDRLPIGSRSGPMPGVDVAAVAEPTLGEVEVQIQPGPRRDWFTEEAWTALLTGRYTVTDRSDRVGLRLDGPSLERGRPGELPSEGMVRGALQVPGSGLPVLLLADAPVTGGYPVIAYVVDADVDRCGQLRAGQRLHFTTRRSRH